MRRWQRERVDTEVRDEQAVVHTAYRAGYGGLTVEVRVVGTVLVDGEEYEFDRVINMALKRAVAPGASGQRE